ncbi:MAG: carbon-nitrogen family hydrolase [Planctomycetes bacterium]|nr:carbon-nitrogen family hydrolase [Planctomycetota bacterium]
MRVLAVQPDIAWEAKTATFERVDGLLAAADVQPGGLIVLPEMFATGFSMNVPAVAEGPGGPTAAWLGALARRTGCTVLGGLVGDAGGGRGRNQAAWFTPQGREGGRYTKVHPFTPAGEPDHYVAGDRPATFALGGFTVAPLICYDLRFPEIFRAAVDAGADLFVVIASWPAGRAAHWRALLIARAIENQAYVVGVNRCGRDPCCAYAGGSLIVDPQGAVLAEGTDRPETLAATLDPAAVAEYRRAFPALADRQKALAAPGCARIH